MPTRFDILNEDSDEEKEEIDQIHNVTVPSYEDLSLVRNDEETVLSAVYGEDYVKRGNSFMPQLHVHIRPPDVESHRIGSELT